MLAFGVVAWFLCSFKAAAVAALEKTPSDFLVRDLEKAEPAFGHFAGSMYAGMLPIDPPGSEITTGELMFWLFVPDKPVANDTMTVWFNGGPGCTSFQGGVLFECSPVTTPQAPAGSTIDSPANAPLVPNAHAWTRATHMLFVEQPAGTGFSWGPLPKDERELSIAFYNWLMNFYQVFGDDFRSKNLYLFGESYAGMYVPSMAHEIVQRNKKAKGKDKVNLAGLGIGNGWMDAKIQGPAGKLLLVSFLTVLNESMTHILIRFPSSRAVIDYAWWHGMIDTTTRDAMHLMWERCKAESRPMPPPFHDFTTPDECNIMGAVADAAGANLFPDMRPNVYDVTTWNYYPLLWDNNATFVRFYNNPQVKQALNAPMDTTWMGCIPGAGRRLENDKDLLPGAILLAHDQPESVVPYVASILDETDVRVLVYNGDRDLTTCIQGSEELLDSMDWRGKEEWTDAPRGVWMVDGHVAGYVKALRGLEFVSVYNSGHLVPHNLPVEALDLITRFVTDTPFLDEQLPSYAYILEDYAPKEPVFRSVVMTWWHLLIITLFGGACFCGGFWFASIHRRRGSYESIDS